MERQESVQYLLERVISLLHVIEKSNDYKKKYQFLARSLRRIVTALRARPVDVITLRSEAYGIFRAFDGPLYNEVEMEAFDLAGDIGILVRKLKQDS